MTRTRAVRTENAKTLRADARTFATELSGAHADAEVQRALSRDAFAFAAQRTAEEIKVRVVNPDPDLANVTIIETLAADAPLLVEGVLSTLNRMGCEPSFIAHPITRARRNGKGHLSPTDGGAETAESFIHVQIGRMESEQERDAVEREIRLALEDAQTIARDQHAMGQRLAEAIAAYGSAENLSPELAEARSFLEWMATGNFLVMGVRTYRHLRDNEGGRLEGMFDIGLGILRDPSRGVLLAAANPQYYAQEYRTFLRDPSPVTINKSAMRSRVGRNVEMDYVAVRIPGEASSIRGELKILGLFAPDVYTAPIRDVPILSRRVDEALAGSGFDMSAHSGRTLARIVEEYPRDELFQLDSAGIRERALAILPLYSLPRVKAILRFDPFGRYVSVMVFVPRDRYDSDLRRKIGLCLERMFGGQLTDFTPAFPYGAALARVRFLIALDGVCPPVTEADIEVEVVRLARAWSERLRARIVELVPRAEAIALGERYKAAFRAGYQDDFDADTAVVDIENIELLRAGNRAVFRFHAMENGQAGLKIYVSAEPMALSNRVPMLDALGFLVVSERTYEIAPGDGQRVWLHDMRLARARGGTIDLACAPVLQQLLEQVSGGLADNDGFNALATEAKLGVREIFLLRALARYLHQAGSPFSQNYMAEIMARHVPIASNIVRLFHARFNPDVPEKNRQAAQDAAIADLESGLTAVDSLDEDRVLRRFANLVRAILRTNFFQRDEDGRERPAIAFKLDGLAVEALPEPRPMFEIFVTSTRVEGVHLRFGKVARGGLRWSDRLEDFRTEVLGLVKAQQVKNAVIVPMGAKGGFVARQLPPPSEHESWLAEGIAAYRTFISSLLDVTDNIVDGRILSPADTVCHDPDDPYLVVAADKGTASFSDTANAIALERNFWLADAFASGGSAGYDHKKMGITARGAWEAVKRHFREIGHDIQTTPFTAAGVGDMSGDVFGNGMLLSPHTRLVAAFDHRHIFIDPDPNPQVSWTERRRLFNAPRSNWADYDAGLISEGGGVYPRTSKTMALGPRALAMLGLSGSPSPQEVIRAILTLDVDLLYFGGIGTYVRGAAESDADAGDRANDAIRVCGAQLRAKVVGEGANLGMTQQGRIEAALAGVRLNTDAIDNSAGVNTSDCEVNIKVALARSVADGRLKLAARNELLAALTEDVAAGVLVNNYSQTRALSCALALEKEMHGPHRQLMQWLEAEGHLDRALERLPDDVTLDRRAQIGVGLTRPELAILLAYAKNVFQALLLDSDAPDDPYLGQELRAYFPPGLMDRFGQEVGSHPLRREIVATRLTNAIVDLGGPAFPLHEGSINAPRIARAFVIARDAFGIDAIVHAIDNLDSRVDADVQTGLYLRVRKFLKGQVVGIGDAALAGPLEDVVEAYRSAGSLLRAGIAGVAPAIASRVPHDAARLTDAGVPDALARDLVLLDVVSAAPDVVAISRETGAAPSLAAASLLAAWSRLGAAALQEVACP